MLKAIFSAVSLAALALAASTPARAVVIAAASSVGNATSGEGAGLSGSFYKIDTTYLTSLAQGRQWTAGLAPTAVFTATATCFPACGAITPDSSGLAAFLGHSVTGLSATVADLSHSLLRLSGYIAIAAPGTYSLSVGADDGTSLSIGGVAVVVADGVYSYQTNTGSATFTTAGLYPFLLEHIENGGSSALSVTSGGVALSSMLYSGHSSDSTQVVVPEPASLALLGVGLTGLALLRRRSGVAS